MLDISWTWIVTIKPLKVGSEYDLRIERCSYRQDSLRDRTVVNRKVRGAAVPGTTWLRTIQIAADASY